MNVKPVQDVNFPAFTTSLIEGVFETIQNNHLMQIKSYSDLLAATSLSLEEFASQGANEVPDESVLEFLQRPFDLYKLATPSTDPADYNTIDAWLQDASGTLEVLTDDSYTDLDELLEYGNKTPDVKANANVDYLMQWVRENLASANLLPLQEMVKMGMQRIVTDEILIKTRLRFKASDSALSTSKNYQSTYGSKAFNVGGNAFFKTKKFGINISAGYSTVKTSVNTANNTSQNGSSADLNMMGYVKIKAHTDYKPLSS